MSFETWYRTEYPMSDKIFDIAKKSDVYEAMKKAWEGGRNQILKEYQSKKI